MTPPEPPAPTVETLLPYAAFMRRLAGHLAGNDADAADLEQEAWLAALRRPPRAEGAIRAWLRIVMGNRRRQQVRGAIRVDRRERGAARREGDGAAPLDVLARAETQRVVVEAVLSLPEPYRRTILLRYLDERSAEDIAALTGVPAATVRQRTRRGLARLREVLDERHGGERGAWLAGLGLPVPFAAPIVPTTASAVAAERPTSMPAPPAPAAPAAPGTSPPVSSPSVGALGMTASTRTIPPLLVAGVAIGLLGLGTWMGLRLGGDGAEPPTPLAPTAVDASDRTGLAASGTGMGVAPEAAPTARAAGGARGDARVVGEVRLAADGRPAAGAIVRATRDGEEIARAVVSATGAFVLGALPGGGSTTIEAVREGAAVVRRAGLALAEGATRDVGTLWLDVAIRVDVRVIGTSASPVRDATVRAFRTRTSTAPEDWEGRSEEAVAERKTGADGVARFDDLAAEAWTFRAEAAGLASGGATLETARRGGAAFAVTIALEAGFPLEGRVRSGTGEPVAGMPVLLLPPRDAEEAREPAPVGPLPHATTTTADGRYRFEAIPRGAWSIAVRTPGGLPARVGVIEVPGVSTFDVTLDGGRVVGRVTEEGRGTPIEGVTIRLAVWRRHHPTYLTARSGPDGTYRIEVPIGGVVNGPPRGDGEAEAKSVHFDASKPGYVRVPVADAGLWTNPWVIGGRDTTIDVVMRPAAALVGTVVGPEGAVVRATVTVDLWDPFAGLVRRTTTSDGEGRWRVDGLAEGRARLSATKEGLVQEPSPGGGWREPGGPAPSAIVDVPRVGEVVREVRLVAGASVSGRVVDGAGRGVAGATVTVVGRGDVPPTGTDAEGAFRLGGARAGETLALRVTRPGSIPAHLDAPAGGPPVTVTLEATGWVRGRVTVEGGRPTAGAFVQVALAKAVLEDRYEIVGVWQTTPRVPVDAGGRFEAPMPVDARGVRAAVVVRAVASGYAPSATAALDVPGSGPLEGVSIGLSKGYEVRGRVVDDAGAPIAGAELELQNADLPPALGNGRDWSATGIAMHPFEIVSVTDVAGRFTIRDLPPFAYALRASAPGHGWGAGEMRVPGGDEPTIVLAKQHALAGRVRYADGTPVANALVVAIDPRRGGAAGQGLADGDGRFEIDGLAAGTYVVEARAPGHVAVDVRPSRSAPAETGRRDVEVVATRGVGALRGRCVGPGGKPVPGASLHAKPLAGGDVVHGRSDPDGRFTLLGLGAGPYALAAEASRTLGGPEAFGTPLVADARGLVAGAEVVLELAPAAELRGRVAREDGGALHPQASVRIRRAGDATWTRFAPVATDGAFAARNLVAGAYELAVVSPGAAEPLARVTAETGATDVRIAIPRAP